MKLSENKLDNLENKMVEGQTILENKVLKMSETFNEDVEGMTKNEIQLSEDVTILEAQRKQVASK